MPKITKEIAELPLPKTVDRARLLEIKDLTDWWRCSRKHIWELTRKKGDAKLPSYKLGRRRLFIYDECYWYLKKQEAA